MYREPGTRTQRSKKLRATTLREARRERESLLAALREGRLAARSDITLGALADEWSATRLGRVTERTIEYDQRQLKRIKPVLGRRVRT
jgi:hypothetical protein